MTKAIVNSIFPQGTTTRMFIGMLRQSPIGFLIAVWRSLIASRLINRRFLPLCCVVFPGVSLTVHRHASATVSMGGRLIVRPFLAGQGRSRVLLSAQSSFHLGGDFEIGQGVVLHAAARASLSLRGRDQSSGSGISADTIVMAEKCLAIGSDVIVAWGCTITDSDWHPIEGVEQASSTVIEDDVWLGQGVTILKGARIPKGCIVGAGSVVCAAKYPEKCLIAGVPGAVKRENVTWRR